MQPGVSLSGRDRLGGQGHSKGVQGKRWEGEVLQDMRRVLLSLQQRTNLHLWEPNSAQRPR